MACIKKLSGGIQFDCETGSQGFINAIVVNLGDVTSMAVAGSEVSTITVAGTWFKIDTVKKSLIVNESLRVNDGAPNGIAQEAIITVYDKNNAELINQLKNSRLALMTLTSRGQYRIYGAYNGLQATALTGSSDANGGWLTFTMSTPEGVIGEEYLTVAKPAFTAAWSGAV